VTAELINLRRARKGKLRDEAEKQAEQNRVKFGRSKVEKNISKFETVKFKSELDGKKRES
jgi:Domain of unknown function (DUF4169)